jgi:AcrR family transcriptional regulator
VNYHFGGRDGLLAEVHRGLCQRRDAWRAARLAEFDGAQGSPVWAAVLAATFDLGFDRRGETLALLEFEALSRHEQPGLVAAVQAEHVAQDRYWTQVVARLGGGGPDATRVWANVAHTTTRFVVLDEAPRTALTWLSPALLRVAERLEGRATPASTPWLAAAERPGALPARPAGAQRLVDAALRIIGRQGLNAVTLRSVAEAAGLSLASTTYFFETKADIVHAAFTQLRDGISFLALSAGLQAADGFSRVLLSPEGEMRWEVGAMHALFLAGARNADLRPVALSLRRLSGQTSSAWLAVHATGPIDRLDAFVWSVFGMGLQERISHLPPLDRKAVMDAESRRAGVLLFSLPDTDRQA